MLTIFSSLVLVGVLVLITSRVRVSILAASARASVTRYQRTLMNIEKMEIELGIIERPKPKLRRPPPAAAVRSRDLEQIQEINEVFEFGTGLVKRHAVPARPMPKIPTERHLR